MKERRVEWQASVDEIGVEYNSVSRTTCDTV